MDERTFTVGLDGSVTGDDGAGGMLAASLRYSARLAAAVSERPLAQPLGTLRQIRTTSTASLTADVLWDIGGECRLRARLGTSSVARTPSPRLASYSTGAEALAAAMGRLNRVPQARWSALIRQDLSVLAAAGEVDAADLPHVGVRALGVLGGLDERYHRGCVWLGFEGGTLVIASLGRHVLCVCLANVDEVSVVAVIEEVRATLAPYDLADLQIPQPEPEPEPQPEDEPEDTDADEDDGEPDPMPMVGARFRGAVASPPRGKRREAGTWFR